jgi:hypothetical protein
MATEPLSMRHQLPWRVGVAICTGILLATSACIHHVDVRTVTAPDANFVGRTTFRILDAPRYRGSTSLAANDPMLVNSITYQAIRDEIRRAFESRGYRYAPQGASLDVAYYATAAPVLDVRTWDYGYTWRGFPLQTTEVYQYEQGTVIIDVIDPATHRLLWRGQGRAPVSTDPNKYVDELKHAVHEIVEKFPPASP